MSWDDYLVTASNQKRMDEYHAVLSKKYEFKRLGFPEKYLGWSITPLPNKAIGISQPLLIDKLVHEMDMNSHTAAHTPYPQNHNLHGPTEDDIPAAMSPAKFAEMVGFLRYIADSTRPDVCFVTSRLEAANSFPTQRHLEVLHKTVRYLKVPSTME